MLQRSINADDIDKAMQALVVDLENHSFREALASAHLQLIEGVANNFGLQQDSSGVAWLPRKPPTGSHPLLRLSYDLYQAAATHGGRGQVEQVEDRTSSIGINLDIVPYARAQNMGNEYIPKWGQTLPAREYYYATEATLDRCDDVIADYAQKDIF